MVIYEDFGVHLGQGAQFRGSDDKIKTKDDLWRVYPKDFQRQMPSEGSLRREEGRGFVAMDVGVQAKDEGVKNEIRMTGVSHIVL